MRRYARAFASIAIDNAPLTGRTARVECQFADGRTIGQLLGHELAGRDQHSERRAEIERSGRFFGRSAGASVDDDPSSRPLVARVGHARSMRCTLSRTASSGKPTTMV